VSDESLTRLEDLLRRLDEARGRLEETEDAEAAVVVLGELSELAREVQAEVERARGESHDALS
jgi:poly(A) polymerase Pap1